MAVFLRRASLGNFIRDVSFYTDGTIDVLFRSIFTFQFIPGNDQTVPGGASHEDILGMPNCV